MTYPEGENPTVTVFQLQAQMQGEMPPLLLDVREPDEFALCHIEGARSMPLLEVPAHLGELDPAQAVVVVCHTGNKSLEVVNYLRRRGFRQVSNLEGGVDLWALAIDHRFPIYGRDPEKSGALKQAFWDKVKRMEGAVEKPT
jgi:rhodanese-related sulfurtransferase